jgi:hypothetical protein
MWLVGTSDDYLDFDLVAKPCKRVALLAGLGAFVHRRRLMFLGVQPSFVSCMAVVMHQYPQGVEGRANSIPLL